MITELKELVAQYEREGLIEHITRRVSSEFEMMAVMKKTKGKIPMLFERVDHYSGKTVTGMGGTRALLAYSMGIKEQELRNRLTEAIANPIPPVRIANGKCQENVVKAPFSLDDYFPVLKHYEKDNGRFVISGMLAAKSIDGTQIYTSIRRMYYPGKNRMTLLITSREMKEQLQYYEERQEPMEIALMFGLVPAIVLSSQVSTHLYRMDKYEIAGGLLREPLKLVKGKTVDLDVIADAQVVLEGKVYPWKKEKEGPFGEMVFYYGDTSELPVCEFSCMTFQNEPLWHTFFPSGSEEKIPMALTREVNLFQTVYMTAPCIRDVFLTMGGAGRYHAVLQIHKENDSDGVQAALAAFASDKDLKHVVVVDEDVDIYDNEEVEWAIASRMQADRDIFIIPGAAGSPLEASHRLTGRTAKMGIDATCPIGNSHFERTHVPGEENINLEDYFERSDYRWH